MATSSDSTNTDSPQSLSPSKHTALPWSITEHHGYLAIRETISPDRDVIAVVKGIQPGIAPDIRANADFILRACNNHYKLLCIVNTLLPEIDSEIEQRQHGGNDEDWCDLKKLSDEGHAAVRDAAGSESIGLPVITEAELIRRIDDYVSDVITKNGVDRNKVGSIIIGAAFEVLRPYLRGVAS